MAKALMPSKATPSRIKAHKCLKLVRVRDAFADDVVGKVIDASGMSGPDRAFATLLVMGVVQSQGALDAVIDRFVDKPEALRPDVRDALRLSTYEIVFLGKSPHAAVDQGVELVKAVQPRAAGLANAVLRKVAASRGDFPYGDPASSLSAYSLLHAFPEWLAEKLISQLGAGRAHAFMVASNKPAPTFVAVSSIRNVRQTERALARMDPGMSPVRLGGIDVDGCFRLSDPRVVATDGFARLVRGGAVLVSDASAQLIAQLACKAALQSCKAYKRKPESCLELCAGRGTKTLLLQSGMNRALGSQFSRYVAVDNVAFKAGLLRERAQEYGVNVTESLCGDVADLRSVLSRGAGNACDGQAAPAAGGAYDLVFLDAPCTGLGTLRRHPEIRWRVTPKAVDEAARLDAILVREASRLVSPGGVLAYSTCTVTREEDEQVVEAFLSSAEGSRFKLLPPVGKPVLRLHLEEGGHDAHFAAFFVNERPAS